MAKRKTRKKKKFRIHTWELVLVLIPLLFLDATLLRQAHLQMVDLREAVLIADEAEDEEAVMKSLTELERFVFSNIVINVVEANGEQRVSFGTGPFYLEHMYYRAANQALEEAEHTIAQDANQYGNIYQLASGVCQPLALQNGWNWNTPDFINCMVDEINKYPSSANINDVISASLPSTELYRRDYVSPVWAPTLTGFLLLITAVLIVVIFIKVVMWVGLNVSLLIMGA